MSVQIISSINPPNVAALDRAPTASPLPPIKPASTSPKERSGSSEVRPDSFDQVNHAYHSLSETATKINQVADSVRQADATMEKVGRAVGRMKGTLEGIIKNYPPFPPGSEQRVRALKDFAALRNEIAKMTFPPEPSLVPKLISDPAKSPGAFNVTLDSKGTSIRLDRQQIDPGPNGLNIPVLSATPPEDSSDEPIYNAISSLKTAANIVSDRRHSLSESFAQQALPAVVASVARQTALSDSTQGATPLSAQTASSKSRAIGAIFSALPVGISIANDNFLKRLT